MIVLMGALWIYGYVPGWGWTAAAGFLVFIGAAAFGALRGLSPWLMLLCVTAALSAWDIDRFALRLGRWSAGRQTKPAIRKHLCRLAILIALGFFVSAAALSVRLDLSLSGALFFGATAILGIRAALRFLDRESS